MATTFSFQCPASGDALGVYYSQVKGQWVTIAECDDPSSDTMRWMQEVARNLEVLEEDEAHVVELVLLANGVNPIEVA